jgi:hypothetical protein
MVTLALQQAGKDWRTLSIARGKGKEYKPQARGNGFRE